MYKNWRIYSAMYCIDMATKHFRASQWNILAKPATWLHSSWLCISLLKTRQKAKRPPNTRQNHQGPRPPRAPKAPGSLYMVCGDLSLLTGPLLLQNLEALCCRRALCPKLFLVSKFILFWHGAYSYTFIYLRVRGYNVQREGGGGRGGVSRGLQLIFALWPKVNPPKIC